MSKVYNFSAGPAVLPQEALVEASSSALEYMKSGMSLMTMSHRSKPVVAMFDETEALIRELLNVPKNYKVLFLQGGASMQFCMVPMNFLGEGESADFTDTGAWAEKAIQEAAKFGKANVIASSKAATYSYIPKDLVQTIGAKYLHVTSNNTIFGTQLKEFPKANGFLVSDMSSDIFSRPINVSDFGIIYAGAQKNMGPAGATLVIIREDLLQNQAKRMIPTMLDYNTHVKAESMFNTPPVWSVYIINRTLTWLKNLGGVAEIQKINERKAAALYAEIDRNPLFKGPAAIEDRSMMNITFVMQDPSLEPEFLALCKSRNFTSLEGHRSVGGFRASIYNAFPEEGVQALIQAMQDFEKR
jgi:phosphoserine aminotransferase